MSLIPITFKADGGETFAKKGKVRAEDLSALFAFSLSNKTGVLNVLGKCNQYNVMISSGVANISLHSGYVSICGRLIYVDEATTVQITLPASGSISGSFGIKVNLANSGDAEVEWYAKDRTEGLIQEDLNENPASGVYEFELYQYNATNNNFTFVRKTATEISTAYDMLETLKQEVEALKTTGAAQGAVYPAYSNGSLATENGTILARLDSLGFKQGNVTINASNSGITQNTVTKQGKIALINIEILTQATNIITGVIATVPSAFKAKTTQYLIGYFGFGAGDGGSVMLKIEGTSISVDRIYTDESTIQGVKKFGVVNGAYEVE